MRSYHWESLLPCDRWCADGWSGYRCLQPYLLVCQSGSSRPHSQAGQQRPIRCPPSFQSFFVHPMPTPHHQSPMRQYLWLSRSLDYPKSQWSQSQSKSILPLFAADLGQIAALDDGYYWHSFLHV